MSNEYRQKSNNAILVKDDVGKAKPTVYDLPAEGHAYGWADPPDAEGAREVTMHWAEHNPSRKHGPPCQDFCKLNRLAANAGVKNATDLARWRTDNNVPKTPKQAPGAQPKVIPSDVIPSFAYGRKSRPSTPIGHVMGNQYGQEQEEALRHIYQKNAEEKDMPNGKHIVKFTEAEKRKCAIAREQRKNRDHPETPKELFKLSKFKNVQGKMTKEEIGLRSGASCNKSAMAPCSEADCIQSALSVRAPPSLSSPAKDRDADIDHLSLEN